jgi:hypothetical protein
VNPATDLQLSAGVHPRITELEAEVARLKAVIAWAEVFDGDTAGNSVCPWCGEAIFRYEPGKHPHKPDCRAFTPEGEVK